MAEYPPDATVAFGHGQSGESPGVAPKHPTAVEAESAVLPPLAGHPIDATPLSERFESAAG